MSIHLTERQQATVATAITILAALVIVGALGAVVWLLAAFVVRFSNVLLPLAVAGVAALVLKPYYSLLNKRLRLPAPLALVAVFLSILLPIAAFFGVFGAIIGNQIVDLLQNLPEYRQQTVEFFGKRWPPVVEFFERSGVGRMAREVFEERRSELVSGMQQVGGQALWIGGRILRWLGALFSWVVLPVYLAFFLLFEPIKVQQLNELLPFLKEETRRDVVYLVNEFVEILVAFFRGQLIVAFFQGCLFALGFSLVGLRYGLVLGLALGFLNVIPYLGSVVGLGVALPLGYFQNGGGLWLVGAVLVVFTLVQLIEAYVLTPRVMGGRTGLHPLAIIVAVFFWGSALEGIQGMILAIPLTAFLVVFWRLLKDKYIGELV